MTFEDRVTTFSTRFLSDRSFDLIVGPALADFQFDGAISRIDRAANYVAVLRAVAGAIREDFTRDSGSFLGLMLLPACYYAFLLVLWSDFFETSRGFAAVGGIILVLSLGPVLACFWPERQPVRRTD